MANSSPLRVGVHGLDSFGLYQWQQFSLRPDFELVAVSVPSETEVVWPAHPKGGTRYNRLQALLVEELDLIVLGDLSAEAGKVVVAASEVLNAGKHLLFAQPCPLSPEQWYRIRTVAEENRKQCAVFFPPETDSEYQTAREVVLSGVLGELQSVRYLSFCHGIPLPHTTGIAADLPEPRKVRGLWATEGLTGLALLLGLVDRQVHRVSAASRNIDEHLQILLEFEGGVRGHWEIDLALPASLSTGWYLQGVKGSFLRDKSYRVTEEGEVVERAVVASTSTPSLFYDRLAQQIRHSGEVLPASSRMLTNLFEVCAAAQASAASGHWMDVSCRE